MFRFSVVFMFAWNCNFKCVLLVFMFVCAAYFYVYLQYFFDWYTACGLGFCALLIFVFMCTDCVFVCVYWYVCALYVLIVYMFCVLLLFCLCVQIVYIFGVMLVFMFVFNTFGYVCVYIWGVCKYVCL